jgi:hypothetical protein
MVGDSKRILAQRSQWAGRAKVRGHSKLACSAMTTEYRMQYGEFPERFLPGQEELTLRQNCRFV